MDRFTAAFIKTHVSIDAGGRVWCKGEQLKIHMSGNEKKVVLPNSKIMYTFGDLKFAGAKVEVVTLKSLAMAGAEGRWKEEIQERRDNNIPSNVYIANARSIEYAIEKGKEPPLVKWIGRKRGQMTETYGTVDEVVDAMSQGKWRTEFSRGSKAKRK